MKKKSFWDKMPGGELFLQERWAEKAEEERKEGGERKSTKSDFKTIGESADEEVESKEIKIYYEMIEAVKQDDDLQPLLADLNKAIISYANNCDNLRENRKSPEKTKELGDYDHQRNISHNALIAALNALSRAYVKKYGKNMWRYQIDEGSGDRERIGYWARLVSKHVKKLVG